MGHALTQGPGKTFWIARARRISWLAALPVIFAAVPAAAADLGGSSQPLADRGGLLLSPATDESPQLFDWARSDPAVSGGDAIVTLDHFTPRLSGLALTLPDPAEGGRRAGLRAGTSGSGAGLDLHPGLLAGQDVSVTIGTGYSSQRGPSLGSADAMTFDTAGIGGRVRISRVSLGSAVFGTRASRFGAGPGVNGTAGAFDLDVSYSFDSGSLSLQHFIGMGEERPGPGRDRDIVALSGRYLLGHSLDMTAWVGRGGAGEPQAVQSDFDGWAMLTGLRLSF